MLKITDHGAVREIQLDRPPVNALDPALVAGLTEALKTAAGEAGAASHSFHDYNEGSVQTHNRARDAAAGEPGEWKPGSPCWSA